MNLGYGNNPYGTYKYGDPTEIVPVTGTGDIKASLDGTSSNALTVKGAGKPFPSGS